jgi:hypothetical protein
VERYRQVSQAGLDAMRLHALRTARYELDLPLDQRRRRVAQRLRAWLALRAEEARPLVTATGSAYRELDLEERLELIDIEHDAAQHSLTYAEAQYIAELVPWLADVAIKLPQPGRGTTALNMLAAAMLLDTV